MPGSIVSTLHCSPWIQHDAEIEVAITKLDEARAAKHFVESQVLEHQHEAAEEIERLQQEQLESQVLEHQHEAVEESERSQQEQPHLQLEQEGVQLQDTAASGGLSEGDIVALLQSTVARVQALEQQNTRLHTENCAQNVVIDHLTAQIKQQQLQAAIIFRQVAQLACLADNYSDEGSDFMLASKFAANILADVLGPRHPHAVAASDNGLGRNYRTSLESLAAFTTAYSTSTTASSANANASKQQLHDAAHRSNEVFQQQRPRHL